MQQFAFSIVALALVATIVALPQVQVFKDGGFAGDSANLPGDYQKCDTLGDGWENSISSLKIDSTLNCRFYAAGDCTEGAGFWDFTGDNFAIPNEANDKFNSYKCGLNLQQLQGGGEVLCDGHPC